MTQATFREGQLVRLRLDQHTGPPDLYQIVSILPVASNGDLQYRLRGIYEAHERMAAEPRSAPSRTPRNGALGQMAIFALRSRASQSRLRGGSDRMTPSRADPTSATHLQRTIPCDP
jgi:hypothetical protein